MSDDLVKRLRNTPNWMREEYAHYKDGLKVFDRAPFEAAYALEAQAARIAELENLVAYLCGKNTDHIRVALAGNPTVVDAVVARAEAALEGGKKDG